MECLDVVEWRGMSADADRPLRLVRHDDPVQVLAGQVPQRPLEVSDHGVGGGRDPPELSLADTETGVTPSTERGADPRPMGASISGCADRRSEWPTSAYVQPRSASIAAEIQHR